VRIVERCTCRVELVLEGDDDQELDAHLARWRVNHMHCHGVELTREAAAEYVAGHPFPEYPVEGSLEWLAEQYGKVRGVHLGCGHDPGVHTDSGCTVAGCACRASRTAIEGATVTPLLADLGGDSWDGVRAELAADVATPVVDDLDHKCAACRHSRGVHRFGDSCAVAGCGCDQYMPTDQEDTDRDS